MASTSTFTKELQYQKARAPMDETLLGMVMLVMDLQP